MGVVQSQLCKSVFAVAAFPHPRPSPFQTEGREVKMRASGELVRMRAFLPILLALLFAIAPVHAAPKPAPELQKAIDAFAGSWTIEEEYPPGGKGHGSEVWRAGPGNLSLIYEY